MPKLSISAHRNAVGMGGDNPIGATLALLPALMDEYAFVFKALNAHKTLSGKYTYSSKTIQSDRERIPRSQPY